MSEPAPPADPDAVVEVIRTERALADTSERFPTGSVPVFGVGQRHVVKLFPASERAFFETECAALARLDGALSIPTPRVIDSGERDGWWFILMSRLAGRTLSEVWPEISAENRRQLMRGVGTALAELRRVPTADLPQLAVDWPGFVAAQRASCRERQQKKGLGSPWLELVEAYLERWAPSDDGSRVVLHTEIMREHLLVERRGDHWTLSGLVDFEPAMIGAPDYELASVGVFVSCGGPGRLTEILAASGQPADPELPMRVMAYALLHRYSNLRWYLERLGAPAGCVDLENLARAWFGS